jgi:hypothetical protein
MRGDREEDKEKVERSIPISARVDISDIARLDRFWAEKGKRMRSISQTVSWSLTLLIEVLEDNQLMNKDEELKNAQMAYDYLTARGIMQRSIEKRGRIKLQNCITMGNLRKEGIDPMILNERGFNMMHNEHSVDTYDGRVGIVEINKGENSGTEIDWDEVDKQVKEAKRIEIEETKRKGIALLKEDGTIKEEEND